MLDTRPNILLITTDQQRGDCLGLDPDGHHKYVWYSQTGREHLFNLQDDPHETHDLANASGAETHLPPWRNRLIEFLLHRPEGFTNGTTLIAGQTHDALLPDYQPNATYPYL